MDDATVLFYESASGQRPIEKFLKELDRDARAKCLAFIDRLAKRDSRLFKQKHAEKIKGRTELWELKPSHRRVEYRLIYTQLEDGSYLILNASVKKEWQLPSSVFDTAESRLKDFKERRTHEDVPPVH